MWLAVAATTFVVAWGGNEFTPLLVMYRQQEGFSPVAVDIFLFAYVVGIIPGLLIGGPMSDRFGRKPLMLPAPVMTVVGSVVLAMGSSSGIAIVTGRVLCGAALGLGMAVGGAWIAELTAADRTAPPGAGARRSTLSLTAGFALGAGAAGALAEWAPWPTALSYAVHITLSVLAAIALLRAPETRPVLAPSKRGRLVDDLKVPKASHRRFLWVVTPVAPWVFGSAASAYAVIRALMAPKTDKPLAMSAMLCLVGLGTGFVVQSLGRRIDCARNARAVVVALGIVAVGMAVAAYAADVLTLPAAIVAAAILGAGYGLSIVSGLLEVQRIAGPDDLAGLTAVFYSITYLGFAVPAIMAALAERFSPLTYPVMFIFGAGLALVMMLVVASKWSKHLPVAPKAKRAPVSVAAPGPQPA